MARHGPANGVLRAAGLTPIVEPTSRAEFATCTACGSDLRYTIGDYGQTLERCTNSRCVHAAPHHPIPAPDQPPRKRARLGPRRGPT